MKILILDIETAPMTVFGWKLWKENHGLNQIIEDSYMLSWGAKWYGQEKVLYADNSRAKNREDDSVIIKKLHKLVSDADVIIGHNLKDFDMRVFNTRCLEHGLKPPSSYRMIDTKIITKKHFRLPSYKLEYLTDKFNKKYKKLKHNKYPGFDLWKEIMLNNNKDAWKEMKTYNIHDVLATEEFYFDTIYAWDNDTNLFNLSGDHSVCRCGSNNFVRNGIAYTAQSQFQRYKCNVCGYEWRSTKSLNRARFTGIQRG